MQIHIHQRIASLKIQGHICAWFEVSLRYSKAKVYCVRGFLYTLLQTLLDAWKGQKAVCQYENLSQ